MKNIIFAVMILISSAGFAADKAPTAVPSANEIKVAVKGMVCAFCAQGIEKKFKAQKEVESVQVSLENKFVKLKFKDGVRLQNEKIAEILKDAGYEADFGAANDTH